MDKETRQKAISLIQNEREQGRNTFNVVYADGTKKKTRLFVYHGTEIAEFNKGSKTKGHYLDTSLVKDILPVLPRQTDESVRFAKNCDKVIALLKQSGWWDNILKDTEFLRASGLEKCRQWEKDYWCSDIPCDHKEERERRRATVPQEFDCETFWMIVNLKIEKMYFGINSEYHLQDIARGVEENRQIHFRIDADRWNKLSYDTTFEFNPEKKKAWFSKEYRGCGNGHYYIALNTTHAAFYEDD